LRSERSGGPYSLLFVDIGQFKALNDNHGHHVGDGALEDVSMMLNKKADKQPSRCGMQRG
jgi:diguanylate cyclase (GGDEF)-like protein